MESVREPGNIVDEESQSVRPEVLNYAYVAAEFMESSGSGDDGAFDPEGDGCEDDESSDGDGDEPCDPDDVEPCEGEDKPCEGEGDEPSTDGDDVTGADVLRGADGRPGDTLSGHGSAEMV